MLPYGFESDALHLNSKVGTNRERYSAAIDYLIRKNAYFLDRLPGQPRQPRGSIGLGRPAF